MTENEAIKGLETLRYQCKHNGECGTCNICCSAIPLAIQALEEIQQYRAIGTIEEFKRAKEMEAVYGQVKWERDIAISQLEEIGVALGQKMEEFKALKEKKKMKPLKAYDEERESNWCSCPNCAKGIGWEYERHFNFCSECGTEFDWE